MVGTRKAEREARRSRSLALDIVGLHLDALAVRVRSCRKVVSIPVVVAVLKLRTTPVRETSGLSCEPELAQMLGDDWKARKTGS